jgi:DNA-binding LacI/PurR family transcriptional regulator
MESVRPTIRDVAAAAGVSPATVSLALNGRGTISVATASHVREVAERMGYRASRTARALRTSRTDTLALVLSTIDPDYDGGSEPSFEYYMRLTRGAARAAFAREHRLLIAPPVGSAAELADLGVDGAIVCDPRPADPQLDLFAEHGVPVVTIEADTERPGFDWHANSDNARTMRILLDHLSDAGARRIALVAPAWPMAWAVESVRAYRAWCALHGVPELLDTAADRPTLVDAAAERAGALLDLPEPPDAIVGMVERCAAGVLGAARRRGLDVPGDLMVASAMDSAECREGSVPITAIDLDPDGLGRAAVDLLVARIRDEDPPRPVLVPVTLRPRASTARVRV